MTVRSERSYYPQCVHITLSPLLYARTTSAHIASVNKLLSLRIWQKHDLPGKTQAVTMGTQFQENIKAAILGG